MSFGSRILFGQSRPTMNRMMTVYLGAKNARILPKKVSFVNLYVKPAGLIIGASAMAAGAAYGVIDHFSPMYEIPSFLNGVITGVEGGSIYGTAAALLFGVGRAGFRSANASGPSSIMQLIRINMIVKNIRKEMNNEYIRTVQALTSLIPEKREEMLSAIQAISWNLEDDLRTLIGGKIDTHASTSTSEVVPVPGETGGAAAGSTEKKKDDDEPVDFLINLPDDKYKKPAGIPVAEVKEEKQTPKIAEKQTNVTLDDPYDGRFDEQ